MDFHDTCLTMATPDDVPGPSVNSDSNLLAEVNSDVLVVEDKEMDQEDCDSKIRVKYEMFFNFPNPKPISNVKCVAKCKICLNSYNYALNSKGNLLQRRTRTISSKLEKRLFLK